VINVNKTWFLRHLSQTTTASSQAVTVPSQCHSHSQSTVNSQAPIAFNHSSRLIANNQVQTVLRSNHSSRSIVNNRVPTALRLNLNPAIVNSTAWMADLVSQQATIHTSIVCKLNFQLYSSNFEFGFKIQILSRIYSV
jgi:hypothetical protein